MPGCGSITTAGTGANGAFATGSGASVTLSGVTINASAGGGHAVMVTQGGAMTMTDVALTTTGGSSSAVATDRGGGTITFTGGTVKTSGNNSVGIYSTGAISATGTTFQSTGAEMAVIEGANSITLTDVKMSSTNLTADAQTLTGNFAMDSISTLSLTLKNGSTLTGAINADKAAKAADVSLDATSKWTVAADSYVSALSDAAGVSDTSITNIAGNGHNVYYDGSLSANSYLGGKVYTLPGGGSLAPIGTTVTSSPSIASGGIVNAASSAAGLVFSGAYPTTATPTVTIGGASTDVLYSGLIAGGLYQLNVRVPSTLAAESHAVLVTQGGMSSPSGPTFKVAP